MSNKKRIINEIPLEIYDKHMIKKRKINELYNSISLILLSMELFGSLFIINNALEGKYDDDKVLSYIFDNERNLYTEEKITYEEIIAALSKNTQLPDTYKNEILKYTDALTENYKYISKKTLLERLSTLKVTELYGLRKENNVPINLSGSYSYHDNEIKLYEKEYSLRVFGHESFHVFGAGELSLGHSLYEGTNELFRSEYSYEVTKERTYLNEKIYSKLLMEIIGSEPFKYLEFRHDISYILNELISIIPDENLAHETIKLVDELNENYNLIGINEKVSIAKNNIININNKLYENISLYYMAKYNRIIDTDNLCMSYFHIINNNFENRKIIYDGTEREIERTDKAYFSRNMINEFGNGIYVLKNIEKPVYQYVSYTLNEAIKQNIVRSYYDTQGDLQLEVPEGVIIKNDIFSKWTYIKNETPRICIKVNETNRFDSNIFTLKLKKN